MRRALLLLLLTSSTGFAETGYTQAMFQRAMAKDNPAVSGVMSDAPLFTLIKVQDRKTGATQERCVLSSFLEGAIEMEHHFGYSSKGLRKIYYVATSTPSRTFVFRSRKARANVAAHYSPQELAEVRQRLSRKTFSQLKREVGRKGSEVTLLSEQYEPTKNPWLDGKPTVVAHVLLERGILVGLTHWGPSLYLDK